MRETIVIKESCGKKIRLLILMLGAAAFCTWAVTSPETNFQPYKRYMAVLLSAVVLPFLVAGIVIMLGRLIRPRPLLVLTAEGFQFGYGFRGPHFVAWSEVSGVSLVKIRSAKILCIALHHRKKYIASLPKVYRWLAHISRSLGYSCPIQINADMTKGYTAEEIVAMMRGYRDIVASGNMPQKPGSLQQKRQYTK